MDKVKDLMTKRVITVPESIGIQQICNILIQNSLSGVPVVNDEQKLVGFVSERDVIAAITQDFTEKKAKDIMCTNIITVKEDTPLTQVVKIFVDKPFRHLPVVKGGEVVGVISRKDVIGKLLVP